MKISYEFYPPKDLDYQKVVNEFSLIEKHGPRFISITYGAMGSSQEKSIGLIKAFKEKKTRNTSKIQRFVEISGFLKMSFVGFLKISRFQKSLNCLNLFLLFFNI